MGKRYLNVQSLAEVFSLLDREFPNVSVTETISFETATNRITSRPIFSKYSVPEIHVAAMDGIAVISDDTKEASEQNPIELSNAIRVNTGNIVPQGYNAVIMIEDTWQNGKRYIIRKAVAPWHHIRPAGEDLAESEMVLPSGHRIRSHEIGALATYGITKLEVYSVKIGLIPTGNELVSPGTHPAPGQVVESNTLMAKAILEESGARCARYPFVEDNPEKISGAIRKAVHDNDIVIVSAGSSAGSRDYTADVIGSLGDVLVHGVSIKPGKPVIVGKIDNKPVFGLPGYPLSAFTVIREIILPFLKKYHLTVQEPVSIQASVTSAIPKDIGSDEFLLCSLGRVGNRWVVSSLSKGSGVQMSAIRANAYIRMPANSEGLEEGQITDTYLMVNRHEAEQALLVTGSHDPVLDYLADMLSRDDIPLMSTHVGSMGGILALKKDVCHAAPTHLLDSDGGYNTSFLRKFVPGGTDIDLICVAERQQGVVSKEGLTLRDLPGRQFVNRQNGSGTRMLLDFELKRAGIDPVSIPGYDRVVSTHIAVALAVKSGEADAGMCVYSAAHALGLKFVPVATERYELAIRKEHAEDPRIKRLIAAIQSQEFKDILRSLGGYDTKETGFIRTVS